MAQDRESYSAEATPTCDLCGRAQGNSPWASAADQPGDWNGETGNHATCEDYTPSAVTA